MADRRAVVIGSGAGGLSSAAFLAKAGFDVVVLERAAHLGGLLAPFERGGYRFDPGLHYVGQCGPGQMVHDLLGELGIDARTLFRELDPDGFDVYRFPDLEVRMGRGLEAYRDRLRALFPADDYGLVEVFAIAGALRDLTALSNALAHRRPHAADLAPFLELPALLRFGRASLADLLGHYLDDPRARAVLAAPAGDYALPPSRASALGALGILAHYGDGAFFPRGGSGALRDALVAAATAQGARFRTRVAAERVIVERGAVRGVRLVGGDVLAASVVVSDADPTVTLGQLVHSDDLPPRLLRKAQHTEPSLGACTLFLGLRRDLSAHGLGAFNVWSYPSVDVEALYAALLAGELPARLPLSSPPARSRTTPSPWRRPAAPRSTSRPSSRTRSSRRGRADRTARAGPGTAARGTPSRSASSARPRSGSPGSSATSRCARWRRRSRTASTSARCRAAPMAPR